MRFNHTKIIQGSVFLLAISVSLLSACGGGSGGGGATADTTAPTILSATPTTGASGVGVHPSITGTFSEAVTVSTVSATSFTLTYGASSVPGTITYSGTTATFTPAADLAYATAYTATIASGVSDSAGNALASNYTWAFTTRTQALNDTGITASQCYLALAASSVFSSALGSCGGAGEIALNPEQDGMVGRDANAATNANNDGKLGFSFTAVTGGCVQDNVTGLMWEVKTIDGGLRDWAKTYTNLGDNSAADASAFVTAVNATNLCGFNDWRLPIPDELQSIVDYGVAEPGPTIDTNWFPNTQGNVFWSASPIAGDSTSAWIVSFGNGGVTYGGGVRPGVRSVSYYVRLVRAGQ
jgi:hypothetical protein